MRVVGSLLLPVAIGCGEIGAAEVSAVKPVVPDSTISLVGDQGLKTHWYTWLTDDGHEDPRGVFAMQPDGVLRITGFELLQALGN